MHQSATAEWERFAGDLTACIGHLQEDEFLILIAKRTGIFVQFAHQGAFGMRAEAVGNQFIEDPSALLTSEQFEAMGNLGWNLPTNRAPRFFGDEPPDGSPNFYQDLELPSIWLLSLSRGADTSRSLRREASGRVEVQVVRRGRSQHPVSDAPATARAELRTGRSPVGKPASVRVQLLRDVSGPHQTATRVTSRLQTQGGPSAFCH